MLQYVSAVNNACLDYIAIRTYVTLGGQSWGATRYLRGLGLKTTENLEKVTRYDKRDSVSRKGRHWEYNLFYQSSGSGFEPSAGSGFEPSASENEGGKDKGGGKRGRRGKGWTGDDVKGDKRHSRWQ